MDNRSLLLAMAFAIAGAFVHAKERQNSPTTSADVYSLQALTDSALHNNYSLKAKELNDKLTYAEVRALAKDALPRVTVKGSYAYYDWLMPNKKKLLDGDVNTDMLIEIVAYQTLYDWNRNKLSRELQLADVSINKEFLRQLRATIIYSVTQTYLNALKAHKKVEVLQNTLDQLDSQYQIANNLYKIGKVSQVDLLKIKVNISVNQRDMETAKSVYQQWLSKLKNIALLHGDSPIQIVDRSEALYKDCQNGFQTNILGTVQSNHPSLKVYDAQIAQEKVRKKLFHSQNKPEVYAFAATNWESAYVPFGNNFNYNVGVGISYTIPYLGGSAYKDKMAKSLLKIEQYKEQKKQAFSDLKKEIDATLIEMTNKKMEVASNKDIVQMATESLQNILLMYQSGQETILNVQDAQSIITEREILYKQAQVEYLELLATLHFLQGKSTYPFNSNN